MVKAPLPPKCYSNTVPEGATVIDSVSNSKFPTGAMLVRFEATGIYALVSAGVTHTCVQREAKAYVEGREYTEDYNTAYQAENIRRVVLKINRRTAPDVAAHLDTIDNVNGYLLNLIREDMKRK